MVKSELKSIFKNLKINAQIFEIALIFLETIEKNNWFEIKFKLKNNRNVVRLYRKENSLEKIFGKQVKQPFSVYFGEKHITIYFRAKQEFITKGLELLKLDFKKPKEKENKGDYYIKIYEKDGIKKLIDFVFINKLELVENSAIIKEDIIHADEVDSEIEFLEGKTTKVLVNSYERNIEAREKCIEHFGVNCQICDFNFQEKFGDLGKNFIHVHHKTEISKIGKEYLINPIKDLIPVCPNCHSMLHKRKPAFSIEEMKKIMN
jgi:hypothetical protein